MIKIKDNILIIVLKHTDDMYYILYGKKVDFLQSTNLPYVI